MATKAKPGRSAQAPAKAAELPTPKTRKKDTVVQLAPAKVPAVAKVAASKRTASSTAGAASKAAAPTAVTLKQLAVGLAERQDLPKKQADTILADVFGRLVDHLKAGERIRIGGLGILEVKDRPARMGRNPATGAAIEIKASKKVAFRVAKELKAAI